MGLNFNDIRQFTKDAPYQVDVSWGYLEWQLDKYRDRGESGGLELDPDYQRGHVWSEEQQIRYVEYRLRGGKAASELYFNGEGFTQGKACIVELVDGKQRLQAARKFLNNEIKAFGYYHRDINGFHGMHSVFRFYINDLKTRAEVLQWYLDLNTGGVVHTTDEIEKVKALLTKEQGSA